MVFLVVRLGHDILGEKSAMLTSKGYIALHSPSYEQRA